MKKNPGRKKARQQSQTPTHVPGSLGLSQVSESIKSDYGIIMNRKVRKQLAKEAGQTFKAYYNGGGLIDGRAIIKAAI